MLGMTHVKDDPRFHFFHFSFCSFCFCFLSSSKKTFSFKHVSLQPLVSEFNNRSFLRSRCSMETWCPDEIGRIAGFELGRLLGGEHDSTPRVR